jgi:dTDP-4-amino-4,6-dideoxygalactose transaminase
MARQLKSKVSDKVGLMSSNNKIPFIQPVLPTSEEMIADYEQIQVNNFFSNNGPFYYEFIEAIENYFDAKVHCSAVANATLGLILALKSSAIKDRKYVLTPSFTFAATALSIIWAGYEPYFVDIEQDTFQLDIHQTRKLLETERNNIAGIMLCNPFGIGLKNISEFEQISSEFNVPLIIDSAAGFGSDYDNKNKVGTKGLSEIFSLHITKPFGISEGGIVCSHDKEFIDTVENLKNFGFNSMRSVDSVGFNAKITEINCAIGLRMLPHLDARINARQKIYNQYVEAFSKHDVTFIDNAERSSLCFASLILPKGWSKYDLMSRFGQDDIEVRDYYNPVLHDAVAFKQYPHLDMTNTNYYAQNMISLPNSETLNEVEVNRIIKVIDNYALDAS